MPPPANQLKKVINFVPLSTPLAGTPESGEQVRIGIVYAKNWHGTPKIVVVYEDGDGGGLVAELPAEPIFEVRPGGNMTGGGGNDGDGPVRKYIGLVVPDEDS